MELKRSSSLGSISFEFHHHELDTLKDISQKMLPSPRTWMLADVRQVEKKKLPLSTFHHIAREVISLERTKHFYCDIMGFEQIPRPKFEAEGVWLYGYGLNLHLIQTKDKEARKQLLRTRINHFFNTLPGVDHVAFVTPDLECIRSVLDKAQVFYKFDAPSPGIEQIFIFDPDGNVVEVSNCGPPKGQINCNGTV